MYYLMKEGYLLSIAESYYNLFKAKRTSEIVRTDIEKGKNR